jgi:hypothetical protein
MYCSGGHPGFPIDIKNIGSDVKLSPAVAAILSLEGPLQSFLFYVYRKSKMAATAIHRLTLDPMGKCSNAFFSETANIIKAKLSNEHSCTVWL